jgi:hypothetical protein
MQMMKQPVPLVRRLAIPVSVAAAIVIPAIQAIFRLGLTPAEFERAGDGTLRAAPYAFGIWALVYAGLIAYAAYQARAQTRDTRVLSALAWPSVLAVSGSAAWIVAAALDWQWMSVAIIVASATLAVIGLDRAAPQDPEPGDRLFVLWPLGLLGGWLTIASAINILNVLTAKGIITPANTTVAGLGGVIIVIALGAVLALRMRLAAYPLPIAWGLAAVFVAERAHHPWAAWAALVGACVLAVIAGSIQACGGVRPKRIAGSEPG